MAIFWMHSCSTRLMHVIRA